MRRILLAVLLLAVAGLAVAGVHLWSEKRAQMKREAAYESILRSYTQVLKPGMTREEVEDYLRAKRVDFQQTCCFLGKSWADLVKIGQEDHPWFCSEHDVYVAFQFANEQHPERLANKLDTLKAVTVYDQLGGCL